MSTPTSPHVLVVDDDPTVSDVVRRYLERSGYRVSLAADGVAGLRLYRREHPDLVVLDLMLPELSGAEVCRVLRAESAVPIIMLTARGEEADRVAGLRLGADDYLTKPFSPRELVLRVRSVLRRCVGEVPGVVGITDGELTVQPTIRHAERDGAPLNLTVREFDLLSFLIRHPGQVFSRKELLQRVWGWSFGDESTVTVHVRRLREKVEKDPAHPVRILTVWGIGYRYRNVDA